MKKDLQADDYGGIISDMPPEKDNKQGNAQQKQSSELTGGRPARTERPSFGNDTVIANEKVANRDTSIRAKDTVKPPPSDE